MKRIHNKQPFLEVFKHTEEFGPITSRDLQMIKDCMQFQNDFAKGLNLKSYSIQKHDFEDWVEQLKEA